MCKKLIISSVILLSLYTFPCYGQSIFVYDSGNYLFKCMQEDYGSKQRNYAMGYIIGVTDTLQGITINIPPEVTKIQIFDTVNNYLLQNPQERHENARVIVLKSLVKAFGKKQP